MAKYAVSVYIFRKHDVLNAEEGSTRSALQREGFGTVLDIEMGRCFIVTFTADDPPKARLMAEDMCKKVLVNHVLDRYAIHDIAEVA